MSSRKNSKPKNLGHLKRATKSMTENPKLRIIGRARPQDTEIVPLIVKNHVEAPPQNAKGQDTQKKIKTSMIEDTKPSHMTEATDIRISTRDAGEASTIAMGSGRGEGDITITIEGLIPFQTLRKIRDSVEELCTLIEVEMKALLSRSGGDAREEVETAVGMTRRIDIRGEGTGGIVGVRKDLLLGEVLQEDGGDTLMIRGTVEGFEEEVLRSLLTDEGVTERIDHREGPRRRDLLRLRRITTRRRRLLKSKKKRERAIKHIKMSKKLTKMIKMTPKKPLTTMKKELSQKNLSKETVLPSTKSLA